MRARGFTLIELMLAMAAGAFGIAAAANFAGMAVRSARRGTEAADTVQQSRLIAQQLRTDLRLAGLASTGAIAVNTGAAPWNSMFVLASGGFTAIPAVRGANNIPAIGVVGAINTVANTDAIQIVVPDPSTLQRTSVISPPGTLISTATQMWCPGSNMVYVSDHGRSNGAGRAQILSVINPGAAALPGMTAVNFGDNLLFSVAPGSDVMCARVSTYWIGVNTAVASSLNGVPWLHRTDLVGNFGPLIVGLGENSVAISLPPVVAGTDLVAPGVNDLQAAYEFSSEHPLLIRGAAPTPPAGRWAFAPGGMGNPTAGPWACGDPPATPGSCWFEVRQARVSLLFTNARFQQRGTTAGVVLEAPAEDGPAGSPNLALPPTVSRQRLATAEVLISERMFDKAVPSTPGSPVWAMPY